VENSGMARSLLGCAFLGTIPGFFRAPSSLHRPNGLLSVIWRLTDFLAKTPERPETEGLQYVVFAFFAEHSGGLFHGPRSGESLGAVRQPVGGHGHDRRILSQYLWLNSFEGIGGRMVRVFVVGRVLIEVDAGQA